MQADDQNTVDMERIEKAVREILLAVGEDVNREGLKGTPQRVARMYAELLAGMNENPAGHVVSTKVDVAVAAVGIDVFDAIDTPEVSDAV